MPELPEVETVRTGLAQHVIGKTIHQVILRREGLRYPFPHGLSSLKDVQITGLRRRAKYLLIDLSDGMVVLSHLGMSGRYTYISADETTALQMPHHVNGGQSSSMFGERTGFGGRHDHMQWDFSDGSTLIYTDPRRFGIVDLFPAMEEQVHSLLESLGPEPDEHWGADELAKAIGGRKAAIKTTLLDQRIVVGLGNIYVCEALHLARINPWTPANQLTTQGSLPTQPLHHLVECLKDVLRRALQAGGSTLNDFASVDGTLGYFPHQFQVYGREGQPCQAQACDALIERVVQAQRSTFYCPSCQPRSRKQNRGRKRP